MVIINGIQHEGYIKGRYIYMDSKCPRLPNVKSIINESLKVPMLINERLIPVILTNTGCLTENFIKLEYHISR